VNHKRVHRIYRAAGPQAGGASVSGWPVAARVPLPVASRRLEWSPETTRLGVLIARDPPSPKCLQDQGRLPSAREDHGGRCDCS
jgi:hypothetical protein